VERLIEQAQRNLYAIYQHGRHQVQAISDEKGTVIPMLAPSTTQMILIHSLIATLLLMFYFYTAPTTTLQEPIAFKERNW